MPEIYSTPEFETAYTYAGSDLGITRLAGAVFFRLWAPVAYSVRLRIYASGTPGTDDLLKEVLMDKDVSGTWVTTVPGCLDGLYYTYLVENPDGKTEACDPYALAVGVNGGRAMIIDMDQTNPDGWQNDQDPHKGAPITDAVIYELHIRDFSMGAGPHFSSKGKYLALTERGLTLPGNVPAGIDHILSLGITHIQLMPVFDFATVDESSDLSDQYNWGYDPNHYFVPEGSYSSDPYHGDVRVQEFKRMIHALHEYGVSVTMDMVFNHVYKAEQFCFNQIVPGYFIRPDSNGSGCGNDTASERSMVRKYIADTLCHWVKEYHIDGFRFDLAGLIDTDTILYAMEAVHHINPHVLFYGEGWNMDTNLTKNGLQMTNQENSALLPDFSFFNDTTRDLLRGNVFDSTNPGFAAGCIRNKDMLHASFMGVTPWACAPGQSINYASCHDNHTLFDRIHLSFPNAPEEEIIRRCKLAASFVMLSQGVPFLLSGEEILRSKPVGKGKYESNSYRSSDRINSIKWSKLKDKNYLKNVDYYRGLIALRKSRSYLRLNSREEVLANVRPIPCPEPDVLAFRIRCHEERMLVVFHVGTDTGSFVLPDGDWKLLADGDRAGTESLATLAGTIVLPPLTTMVLVQSKPKQIIDVVAALLWKGDRFLICQRPAHKARGLLWEFVGGKTEPGETKEEALRRECKEELDIDVHVGNVFMEVIHKYPDIHIRLTLYHCTLPQGSPKALEHNELQWITPEQIPQYDFCPADKDILKQIQKVFGK